MIDSTVTVRMTVESRVGAKLRPVGEIVPVEPWLARVLIAEGKAVGVAEEIGTGRGISAQAPLVENRDPRRG